MRLNPYVKFVPAPARPVATGAFDRQRQGVYPMGDGVDVVVRASRASRVDVCFWINGKEVNYTLQGPKLGSWHGHVAGIRAGTEYGFRVYGRWNPYARLRHNPAKLLLDPYARGISGTMKLGPELYDFVQEDDEAVYPLKQSNLDSAPSMVRGVVLHSIPNPESRPRTPWEETVIYEAHVKGLTMELPGLPEELRGTYAGLAHPYTLAHLKRLGVTAVELLPIHALMSEPALTKRGLVNYWGYSTLNFFSPEPSYATASARAQGAGAVLAEVKGMVQLMHEAGLEVILDVVYNHTCEGGFPGTSLSFRGLDNSTYYLQDDYGNIIDYTGTGNSLNFQETAVVQLALDSLRYWVTEVGVDGFRFDLATTLGRNRDSFSPRHPFLVALATDPVLRTTKLIAEPWDVGPGGWRTGQFPAPMSDWNDRYRNTVRQFWLSDAAAQSKGYTPIPLTDLGSRLSGSADIFGFGEIPGGRLPRASINFITAHDGFTMRDLVSYDMKHNLLNGEDNRDGTNDNRSWNHGFEGDVESSDPHGVIRSLRRRSIRNMLGTLLVSAGTPMITAGDEIGRTQQGNNNAYCQDNQISWMDWDLEEWQEELFTTACHLVALRRENPALRPTIFASGRPLKGDELADLSWWDADGEPKSDYSWHNPHDRTVQMLRSGDDVGRDALVIFNGSLNDVEVTLASGRGNDWELVWDSAWELPGFEEQTLSPGDTTFVELLSMQIYLETPIRK